MFVTGKGGTGKSTIAAAIATAAARGGARVLVCEMDAKGALAAAFGASAVGWEPVPVADGVWAMTMDTEESLREYLRIHLRLPLLTRIAPLASMFDFVADAAPGVREVLAVGKVCWEVRERKWDLVVVDAEASGHVVAQIASPRTIGSLVPRGPLRDQTAWMLGILEDPECTGVVVVATPEELAVTEAQDLVARLRAGTNTEVAAVVLNMVAPVADPAAVALARREWFAHEAPVAWRSVSAAAARHDAHDEWHRHLEGAVHGVPVLVVDRVAGTGREVTERVADAFLGGGPR